MSMYLAVIVRLLAGAFLHGRPDSYLQSRRGLENDGGEALVRSVRLASFELLSPPSVP